MAKPPEYKGSAGGTLPRPTAQVEATVHTPLGSAQSDHPFFSLIGRVSAEWAQYEHILDLIIWDLSKHTPAIMACVTGQITSSQARINAIMALLITRSLRNGLRKKCRDLLRDTHAPSIARNRIVHDAWFVGAKTSEAARYKKMARDEWTYGAEPVTEAQIQQTIEEIRALHATASQLRRDVLASLAPLPGKD